MAEGNSCFPDSYFQKQIANEILSQYYEGDKFVLFDEFIDFENLLKHSLKSIYNDYIIKTLEAELEHSKELYKKSEKTLKKYKLR